MLSFRYRTSDRYQKGGECGCLLWDRDWRRQMELIAVVLAVIPVLAMGGISVSAYRNHYMATPVT